MRTRARVISIDSDRRFGHCQLVDEYGLPTEPATTAYLDKTTVAIPEMKKGVFISCDLKASKGPSPWARNVVLEDDTTT